MQLHRKDSAHFSKRLRIMQRKKSTAVKGICYEKEKW